ncbi:MAG TPA: RidA family protein [Longimicrobium sp.]|nr:RidA family protein [Longimicrobium sp.]
MKILQPEGWGAPRGYSNGIEAQGRLVFVAGQIGWNPQTCAFETDDFVGQVGQALRNVRAVLAEAGAGPEHLTRMTWYVTDRAAYMADTRALGRLWRETFGRHYPAMTLVVVAGLLEERARIEIEATAVVPG